MKFLKILLVFVFFCLAASANAEPRIITDGVYDYHVGRFTSTDKWEVDTHWFMQGTNSFLTTVSNADIQPVDLIQARNGVLIPAFTLNYTAEQSRGNVALDGVTGFVGVYYGNINRENSTTITFNIPEHTMAADVWDLPFTMHGNIVMFWFYTPFSAPNSSTPISGSGKVHLKYMRQTRNLKSYFLQLAHFEFDPPTVTKTDSMFEIL